MGLDPAILTEANQLFAFGTQVYDRLHSIVQYVQAKRAAGQHQADQRSILDLALMGTRLGLDEALRHPTLSPDARGSLRPLDGERLTALSQEVLGLTEDQLLLAGTPSQLRGIIGADVAARLDARQNVLDLVARYRAAGRAVQDWRAADAALNGRIEDGVQSPGAEFARRVDQVKQASDAYERAWTSLVEAARSSDAALSALEDWDRRRGRDSLLHGAWNDVRLAEPLTWTPGGRWMEHRRVDGPAGPAGDLVRFDYARAPAEVELAWRAALACTAPDRGLYASTPELAERIDRRWGEAFLPDHPPLCDELKLMVLSAGTDRSPELEQMQEELQQVAGGVERADRRFDEIATRAVAARLGFANRNLQDLDQRQLGELQDRAVREMQRLSQSPTSAGNDAAWKATERVYTQAKRQQELRLDDRHQGHGPDQGPRQRRT